MKMLWIFLAVNRLKKKGAGKEKGRRNEEATPTQRGTPQPHTEVGVGAALSLHFPDICAVFRAQKNLISDSETLHCEV